MEEKIKDINYHSPRIRISNKERIPSEKRQQRWRFMDKKRPIGNNRAYKCKCIR
jgi:hypothetical protein